MNRFNKSFYSIILFLVISASVFAQNSNYVILISFDGFRWDYANRGITPNLDFIKENGVTLHP